MFALLHRRRTSAVPPPPSLTTTVDITALPDATLTPAERAWDAYQSIKNNPDCWAQSTYGALRDGRVVGCFAHHVVRRAGYDIVGAHGDTRYRDWVRVSDLAQSDNPRLTALAGFYEYFGSVPVEAVANNLLGLDRYQSAALFSGGNSLARVRQLLQEMYGPEPAAH